MHTALKRVEIHYFALFREARGIGSETVSTGAATPGELFHELRLDETQPLDISQLRVAVNDEFASWDTALTDGDRVVFLAPVSGG